MNKPNTPPTARDAIARLSHALARLAQLAAEICAHVPDDAPQPKRKPVRPPKYKTDAERVAARRRSWNAYKRKRARIAKRGARTAPRFSHLRTPADMPPLALRAGACAAAGLHPRAVALALAITPGNAQNALHRFKRHAGLTMLADAVSWFESMRRDPAQHRPALDRLQWAMRAAPKPGRQRKE